MTMTTGWGTGSGRRALLASPTGERHTLGLITFGIALARRGWRITYLGGDTPASSLTHAAAKTDPAAIVLASSRAHWFLREAEALALLGAKHRVCIAGQGATAAVARRINAERLTDDPVTAASVIASRRQNRPA